MKESNYVKFSIAPEGQVSMSDETTASEIVQRLKASGINAWTIELDEVIGPNSDQEHSSEEP